MLWISSQTTNFIILLDTISYRFRTHGMGFAKIEQRRYLSFSKEKPNLPGKDSFRPEIGGRFILAEGGKREQTGYNLPAFAESHGL
jgi:hypothetical protein